VTNILFSWVNHVDTAALAASSAAGSMTIAGVANPIIGKRWRTLDLGAYGQADFGADKAIGIVALVFPRDTMGALAGTVRHRFDTDGGAVGNGAAHDSGDVAIGAVEGYGYHVYIPPSPVTARYWRWTYAASGVAYIDTGRAWAGEAWQPEVNFSYGQGDTWDDLSRISVSDRSGAEFVDERARRRLMDFALEHMSEADRQSVRELRRIVGISRQILTVLDPDSAAKETILGRLAETNPILHTAFPIFSTTFRIRESL